MAALPNTFRKLVAQRLTSNFRNAVEIVSVPMVTTPGPDEVVVKIKYAGVNATDVNITAGRYGNAQLPFGTGLEGVGEVVTVGKDVLHLKPGQIVGSINLGAFSEYLVINETQVFPLPDLKPEYVSLFISGLTAAIALDRVGEVKPGNKVLVTAAAGALGQICVQYLKQEGCHVIGLCSSLEKANIITQLGCDHVINYKEEDVDKVLKEKYPDGLDVIWETIGGTLFKTLTRHLAVKGRLVVIGAISGYKAEGSLPGVDLGDLPVQLLFKSASIRGFLLTHFPEVFGEYFVKLLKSFSDGKIKFNMDDGSQTSEGKFVGLEGAIRGVEHLHSGKSTGKVYVTIQ